MRCTRVILWCVLACLLLPLHRSVMGEWKDASPSSSSPSSSPPSSSSAFTFDFSILPEFKDVSTPTIPVKVVTHAILDHSLDRVSALYDRIDSHSRAHARMAGDRAKRVEAIKRRQYRKPIPGHMDESEQQVETEDWTQPLSALSHYDRFCVKQVSRRAARRRRLRRQKQLNKQRALSGKRKRYKPVPAISQSERLRHHVFPSRPSHLRRLPHRRLPSTPAPTESNEQASTSAALAVNQLNDMVKRVSAITGIKPEQMGMKQVIEDVKKQTASFLPRPNMDQLRAAGMDPTSTHLLNDKGLPLPAVRGKGGMFDLSQYDVNDIVGNDGTKAEGVASVDTTVQEALNAIQQMAPAIGMKQDTKTPVKDAFFGTPPVLLASQTTSTTPAPLVAPTLAEAQSSLAQASELALQQALQQDSSVNVAPWNREGGTEDEERGLAHEERENGNEVRLMGPTSALPSQRLGQVKQMMEKIIHAQDRRNNYNNQLHSRTHIPNHHSAALTAHGGHRRAGPHDEVDGKLSEPPPDSALAFMPTWKKMLFMN